MITQELQNKLVTRCQNPRTVVNKYTHESVVVSCGSCPSCILRRSGIQTNLLTSYSMQFRFVYFVTLTYADRFLPTLQVEIVENCSDDIADVSCVPEILDVTNGNRTVVKEFPYRIEAPNWTPDGQWLLYNSDGKLYRLSPTSPAEPDRKSTRLNSSHTQKSRMPSSA